MLEDAIDAEPDPETFLERLEVLVADYREREKALTEALVTAQEMRVLQEFRRVAAETLPVAAIKAIKHPAGGGEAPAVSLVAKGYLSADAGAESYTLTQKAKDFLALEVKPEFEEAGSAEGAEE